MKRKCHKCNNSFYESTGILIKTNEGKFKKFFCNICCRERQSLARSLKDWSYLVKLATAKHTQGKETSAYIILLRGSGRNVIKFLEQQISELFADKEYEFAEMYCQSLVKFIATHYWILTFEDRKIQDFLKLVEGLWSRNKSMEDLRDQVKIEAEKLSEDADEVEVLRKAGNGTLMIALCDSKLIQDAKWTPGRLGKQEYKCPGF